MGTVRIPSSLDLYLVYTIIKVIFVFFRDMPGVYEIDRNDYEQ